MSAQANREYSTRSGLRFSLPARLEPQPEPPAGSRGLAALAEHWFDDARNPGLQIAVLPIPRNGDAKLRPDSAAVRHDIGERVVQDTRVIWRRLYFADAERVQYDPERGAISVRVRAYGPSPARTVLRQSDDSHFWRSAHESGHDTVMLRCILTELLADGWSVEETQLWANRGRAEQRCRAPASRIASYVSSMGVSAFTASELVFRVVTFLTRTVNMTFYVFALVEREHDVDSLADGLWSTAAVPLEARYEALWLGPDYFMVVVLGTVLAVLVLFPLLMLALYAWLSAAAFRLVALGFLGLNVVAFLSLMSIDTLPGPDWLRFALVVMTFACPLPPMGLAFGNSFSNRYTHRV